MGGGWKESHAVNYILHLTCVYCMINTFNIKLMDDIVMNLL